MLIETSTFRLAAGADDAAFLEADRVLQAELSPMPGFLRRTTARGEEGEWLVLVLWRSAADADAAGRAATPPDLVDPASLDVRRYATLD